MMATSFHSTGSNRWNPHDGSCRYVAGNTEGKTRSDSSPRNDSGDEIPGWLKGHNTPALIIDSDSALKLLRSGERIVYATGNRGDHEVPTCTNGVTLATLSRPETQ